MIMYTVSDNVPVYGRELEIVIHRAHRSSIREYSIFIILSGLILTTGEK